MPGLAADVVGAAVAYRLSAAIAAAVELDIASSPKGGPAAVPDVAQHCGVDERGLRLLLRALASEGIFSMSEVDVVMLNDPARILLPKADGGQRELFLGWYSHPALYSGLAGLAEGLRRGAPAFEISQARGFFDWLNQHPAQLAAYQAAVGGEDPDEFTPMLDLLDLSAYRVVADIGGGRAGLLRAALDRWPHLRGVLIELPEVAASTAERLASTYRDRIECVGADCRQEVPSGADVYVMTTVLRYFDDPTARRVLGHVREALQRAAEPRLLVLVEMLVDEGPPSSPGAIKSLLEYALTGGEDRTAQQLTRLLQTSGYTAVQHQHWDGPYWVTTATTART